MRMKNGFIRTDEEKRQCNISAVAGTAYAASFWQMFLRQVFV